MAFAHKQGLQSFIYAVRQILHMANIDITKMSSKGQVVIPVSMRKGLKEGEKLVIIRSGSQIIMKRARDFDPNIEEDLEFARRTEKALEGYLNGKGKFVTKTKEEFIAEMERWRK